MRIAIATYDEIGRFGSFVPNEDDMIFDLFRSKKHEVDLCVWDDESVDWNLYDVVIVKSTWDYFVDKIEHFYQWLEKLKSLNIPCLNSADIIRWNADKHYLLEIEKAGLPIVPSIIIEKDNKADEVNAFETFGVNEIVVKPCISGGAMNTIRIKKEEYDSMIPTINEWLKVQSYLVQPLKHEIMEEGEWSLIYFNSKLSHTILKSAKEGEFRIQHFFGGKIEAMLPSDDLVNTANKYIEQFAKDTLYARVDGVITKNGFELMELELIEPYLFFFTNEFSLNNYYHAFISLYEKIKNDE